MVSQSPSVARLRADWPVVAGLLVLYVPTYSDLVNTFWMEGRSAQGPIILALVAWLIVRERAALYGPVPAGNPASRGPLVLFVVGLACYVLGRSQTLFQLELASQIPVLLGAAGLVRGARAARRLAFPVAFSVFLIPVPGTLLEGLLVPLKECVSMLADASLHAFGYPTARNGVVLTIGPYQLLIADACSGLNSMVALTGIGLLYAWLNFKGSLRRGALLLSSILPVAFLANLARVLLLLLITYYGGDDAGRAFHSWAAYLEIVLALAGLFSIDWLAARLAQAMRPRRSELEHSEPEHSDVVMRHLS